MQDFGPRLRSIRLRHGLTQADLAERSGLGQSTISSLENGRQAPWPSTRRALARAFDAQPDAFDALIGAATLDAESAGPDLDDREAAQRLLRLLGRLGAAEPPVAALPRPIAASWTCDAAGIVRSVAGSLAPPGAVGAPLEELLAALGGAEPPRGLAALLAGPASAWTIWTGPRRELGIASDPEPEGGATGIAILLDGRRSAAAS